MNNKYLLYIDILGFADLVQADKEKVETIYRALDRLNVHKHDAFKTIIFSDTILVFNKEEPLNDEDHQYLVMFSCEFVQDLQKWCTKINVQFRAILVYGEFKYDQKKNLEAYFGAALITAYRKEKELQAMGLFIAKDIAHRNTIFHTVSFDADVDFVFLAQNLEDLSRLSEGQLPIPGELIWQSERFPFLWLELLMLKILKEGLDNRHDSRVRAKYALTYQLYVARYPLLLQKLEAANFDLKAVNAIVDWNEHSIDWWR